MPDGSTAVPIMGSYGIGVERAIAAIAEVHHDDAGLAWPVQVAPAEVTVLLLSVRDAEARAAAEVLYSGLLDAGVDALIDDRDVRPGVKYADAELTGIPYRISVGSRDLAEGVVEITMRANGEKERVPVGEAVGWVRQAITAALVLSAGRGEQLGWMGEPGLNGSAFASWRLAGSGRSPGGRAAVRPAAGVRHRRAAHCAWQAQPTSGRRHPCSPCLS